MGIWVHPITNINIIIKIIINININIMNIDIIVASGCAVQKKRLDVLWGARSPFLLLPSTILTLTSPSSFPSSTSSTTPSYFSSSYYSNQLLNYPDTIIVTVTTIAAIISIIVTVIRLKLLDRKTFLPPRRNLLLFLGRLCHPIKSIGATRSCVILENLSFF